MTDSLPIENCTAAILAGGESRRMGADKAAMLLHGKPLWRHVFEAIEPLFADVMVSVRAPREDIPCAQIVDRSEDRGPMVGIKAALERSRHDWLFVIGCDMPAVSRPLIRLLADRRGPYDAVVMHAFARPQPLFGFYAKSCLPKLSSRIDTGERSMIRLLNNLDCRMLDETEARSLDPSLQSLTSLDSPADVKRMEAGDA